MQIASKIPQNQHPTAPPTLRLIDRADHRGKSDITPLGVITLITLACPLIQRIDQSGAGNAPSTDPASIRSCKMRTISMLSSVGR